MKPNDRNLLAIAKADINTAKKSLAETDEVYVNIALFHTSQAVEKILKFLCSCHDIDYDYSHFLAAISEKLLKSNVIIPELVLNSLDEYASWATKSRYTANQMVLRRYIEKHIECIEEWIKKIDKQIMLL